MNKKLYPIVALMLVLFCCKSMLLAQPSKEEKIRYILNQTISIEILTSTLKQQLAEQDELPPEIMKMVIDLVLEEINLNEYKNSLIPVYDEFFSDDEITSLTTFYRSETGAKYAKAQPGIDLQVIEFLVKYTTENLSEIILNGKQAYEIAEEIDSLFHIGEEYYQNEDFNGSIEHLSKIEEKYLPDFESKYFSVKHQSIILKVYSLKYTLNSILENYQAAINNLETILEHYPTYTPIYENLAETKMKIKDYQGVVSALTEAIALDEAGRANYYSDRALAKDYLGDHNGADADYDSTLTLIWEGDYSEYSTSIGWNKYLVRQYENCIEYSDKALETNPDLPSAGYNKALANLCLGNSDIAMELYKEFKEKSENSHNRSKYNSDAINNLKDLLSTDFKTPEVKQILIEVFNLTESELNE